MAGRPTKLDELAAKRICDAVAAGNTRRCAAQAAGIDVATLCAWARRGRRGEAPFRLFFQRLQRADAQAEQMMVDAVVGAAKSGAPGSWKAAEFWLRYRRSRTWRAPVEARVDEPEDLSEVDEAILIEAVRPLVERKKKS